MILLKSKTQSLGNAIPKAMEPERLIGFIIGLRMDKWISGDVDTWRRGIGKSVNWGLG